jgi:hypothetical protein
VRIRREEWGIFGTEFLLCAHYTKVKRRFIRAFVTDFILFFRRAFKAGKQMAAVRAAAGEIEQPLFRRAAHSVVQI